MSSKKKRRPTSSDKPISSTVSPEKTSISVASTSPVKSEAVAISVPPLELSDRFWMATFIILMLGTALRQVALGPAPFHPDEAIHAFFSQNFATYKYDPVYHGPLLYHLTSAIFGLLGTNDYTARLMPSLMGILLLWMILFPARQWLGTRGALAAAGLVALSTSIVTYSRHLLHDSLVLVLTFGAVLCFAGMWTRPANTAEGRSARLGLAAFLTLFLATKANCFFIFVMLLAYFVAWRMAGRLKMPAEATRWLPPLCFLSVSLGSILFPVAFDHIGTPEIAANPQHTFFQILVLSGCGLMWFWLWTREPEAPELEAKQNAKKHADLTTYILFAAVCLWIYVFLFGNGAQILQQWALNKSFPSQTLVEGRQSAQEAIGKMLGYWGGQQKKPRLPGQHDYYIILSLLYEVPILLAAIGGIWHYAKNRTAWTDLLLWWGFTSWAIYAVANEKVPWLLVHMMFPFALLGGMWLGQIRWKKPVLAVAMALGLIFSGRGDIGMIFQRAGDNAEPILYAQSPDAFRDAVEGAMKATLERPGALGMANDKQWPAVWYFRRSNPLVEQSPQSIGGVLDMKKLRVMVGQPASEDKDTPNAATPEINPKEEEAMLKAGWDIKTVDFLIWPRVHWSGIRPDRYWRWWITRDTLPQSERDKPQSEWNISILSGTGEWSHARAVVGNVK